MSEAVQATPQVAPETTSAVEGTPAPQAQAQEQRPDPRLVQLARRERMLRDQQREIKMQQEILKNREIAFETGYIKKEDLRRDALGVLKNEGIDYDQLTQAQLINLQSQDPMAAELARQRQVTEQLQAKLDQFEKSSQENSTQSYEQAKRQMNNDVKRMVESDERYEAIRASGEMEMVVDVIEENFKATGEILDIEDVAEVLEDKLTERFVNLAKLKKVQSRLAPAAPTKEEVTQAAQVLSKARRSNNITVTPRTQQTTLNSQIQGTTKPMSARERAILAGKGLLK